MQYKDILTSGPDTTSVSFLGILGLILILILFFWIFSNYIYHFFDCDFNEKEFFIKAGILIIKRFELSRIGNIKHISLLEFFLYPFAIRLVSFSMYFLPSYLVTIGKVQYIVTPKNSMHFSEFIKRFKP